MILHIPHSSIKYPGPETTEINLLIQHLTDWFTDDLFQHEQADRIVFPYSRVYVDVERLRDDPMEKIGQGILYSVIDYDKEKRIKLYNEHHKKLNQLVETSLSYFGEAVIVDCHSFTDEGSNIDVCLGYNKMSPLVESLMSTIKSLGLTLGDNHPFRGSILPERFKDENVESVMIEINKRLYINSEKDYNKTKNVINTLLNTVKEHYDIQRDF